MSEKIKALLHEKRAATEAHIRQLEAAGTQGVRYTATIPDMSFLVLGLLATRAGSSSWSRRQYTARKTALHDRIRGWVLLRDYPDTVVHFTIMIPEDAEKE